MTWHHAMEVYGSDKPDVRFGLELRDLSEVFAATEFRAFQAPAVKGMRLPGEGTMSRAQVDKLVDRAKQLGAAGLVWMRVLEHGALDSPVAKFLSESEQLGLCDALGGEAGDLLLVVAGAPRLVDHVLGTLRVEIGRPPVHEGGLHFLWVVDFPLFEGLDDDGRPIPAHHPFTMPHPDDMEILEHATGEDLLGVRSQAYDLVLNGWELGSGSVRIHRRDIQARIFSMLGITEDEAQSRFGFLLDAFRYGAPPHAGFAFGIDRLVGGARGRRQHPRGDRVPEDAVGCRSAHRGARAARPCAAPGTRLDRHAPPKAVAQGGGGYDSGGADRRRSDHEDRPAGSDSWVKVLRSMVFTPVQGLGAEGGARSDVNSPTACGALSTVTKPIATRRDVLFKPDRTCVGLTGKRAVAFISRTVTVAPRPIDRTRRPRRRPTPTRSGHRSAPRGWR